jgi:hypothetical protein
VASQIDVRKMDCAVLMRRQLSNHDSQLSIISMQCLRLLIYKEKRLQVWWHMIVIPTLRRLRQEDFKLEANLGYTDRPYLKKNKIN